MASHPVDHRIDDVLLMSHVEDVLLGAAGWSYPDLTHIACVIGPGGFTSLRVAVALSNTLSHELGIPQCGVHLSDIYAVRAQMKNEKLTVKNNDAQIFHFSFSTSLWLHSTKKHELFIRQFPAEPRCVTLDELRAIIKPGMQWMGELIPEHRVIVEDAGVTEAPMRSLADVLPAFLQAQKFGAQILTPWYGRGW